MPTREKQRRELMEDFILEISHCDRDRHELLRQLHPCYPFFRHRNCPRRASCPYAHTKAQVPRTLTNLEKIHGLKHGTLTRENGRACVNQIVIEPFSSAFCPEKIKKGYCSNAPCTSAHTASELWRAIKLVTKARCPSTSHVDFKGKSALYIYSSRISASNSRDSSSYANGRSGQVMRDSTSIRVPEEPFCEEVVDRINTKSAVVESRTLSESRPGDQVNHENECALRNRLRFCQSLMQRGCCPRRQDCPHAHKMGEIRVAFQKLLRLCAYDKKAFTARIQRQGARKTQYRNLNVELLKSRAIFCEQMIKEKWCSRENEYPFSHRGELMFAILQLKEYHAHRRMSH